MLLPLDVLSLLFLSLSASHLALVLHASAALVNVTVDDTFGDPSTGKQVVYSPQGAWQPGQFCTTCTAHPDKSLAFNGTWHDSTFNDAGLPGTTQLPVATFSFVGAFPHSHHCIHRTSWLTRTPVEPRCGSICLLRCYTVLPLAFRKFRYEFLHRRRSRRDIPATSNKRPQIFLQLARLCQQFSFSRATYDYSHQWRNKRQHVPHFA